MSITMPVRPGLPECAGYGPAEDGDRQAEQRYRDDGDGNEEQPGRADHGQAGGRAAPGDPAGLPDDRGDREDEQAGDHVHLEHRAAEGRERQRGSRPRQRGALAGQAGVALLRVVARPRRSGWRRWRRRWRRRGHYRAETSTTMAAMTAITVTVAARIHGRIDCGSGSARRSARWLRPHST